MGLSYPATPKIYNFPPPMHPTVSAPTRLPLLPLLSFVYWCPLSLPNSPAQPHTPALPSSTLGISNTIPAHPGDPICHPNEPWLPGKYPIFTVFLAGGVCPIIIYIDHVWWAKPLFEGLRVAVTGATITFTAVNMVSAALPPPPYHWGHRCCGLSATSELHRQQGNNKAHSSDDKRCGWAEKTMFWYVNTPSPIQDRYLRHYLLA